MRSDHENEDIDLATALSLSEKDQNVIDPSLKKGMSKKAYVYSMGHLKRGVPMIHAHRKTESAVLKHILDSASQLEEDEQLARAFQESLNVQSPPSPLYGNGNGIRGNSYQTNSTGFRICAGCKTEISHGRLLNCMGAAWHPECFRCHACKLPISDYEFSLSGNHPYHQSCDKEHYHQCDVCRRLIPTNSAALIEFKHHFGVQNYCPSHEDDGTPRCWSCEQMEPWDTSYIPINDGQKLCLECLAINLD